MILGRKFSVYNAIPTDDGDEYEYYRNPTDFIKRFVDHVIISTLHIIDNMENMCSDVGPYITDDMCLKDFENEWPTCGNINPQKGLEAIRREMEKWNALPPLKEWMHHVDFIALERENNTEFYTYQVLWSVPIPAYPEPMVTVSVFFYIAASHVHPAHFPVDVTYVFEGHRFRHHLNAIFRPKWIYDVFDMKTMMFESFDF